MMDLCARYRGEQQEYKVLEGTDRAILKYKLPLSGECFKTRKTDGRNCYRLLFRSEERQFRFRLLRLRGGRL